MSGVRWDSGDRVRAIRPPESYRGEGVVWAVESDEQDDPGLVQVRWDDPGLDDELMYPDELEEA